MSMGTERDITPDFLGAKICSRAWSIPTCMLSRKRKANRNTRMCLIQNR